METDALQKLNETHFDGVLMDLADAAQNRFDVPKERGETIKQRNAVLRARHSAAKRYQCCQMLGAEKYFRQIPVVT